MWWLLLGMTMGCQGDDAPPTVEVGTGDGLDFESLAPDDTVPVIYGYQGGYHIFGAARVCHMQSPYDVVVSIVEDDTDTEVGYLEMRNWSFFDGSAACEQRAGMVVFLDTTALGNDAAGDLLDGRFVHMNLEITDSDGVVESDSRRVACAGP